MFFWKDKWGTVLVSYLIFPSNYPFRMILNWDIPLHLLHLMSVAVILLKEGTGVANLSTKVLNHQTHTEVTGGPGPWTGCAFLELQ